MSEDPAWGATAAERAALEPVLREALARSVPTLAEPVQRVLTGGGRLRPSLTIAAAGARDRAPYPAPVLTGAASVELLHGATLVHDDVIDGAPSRHGQLTINAREGVGQAVLIGDLLIATSFVLAARVGPEASALMAETLARLCVGQAREDSRRFDAATNEADAMAVAAGKTGSLLGAACRLGALVADLDPGVGPALEDFGTAFGISLQLLDDVLDVTSTADRLGKPVGADFPAGTITLPAVVALAAHPELRALVRPGLTPPERERAAILLRDPDAVGYTVRQAARQAERAEMVLSEAVGDTLRCGDGRSGSHAEALRALAGWPRLYLDAQLRAKVDPRHRWLVGAAMADGSRA